MKHFKDSKGAVSVFLAIILIPCIVVTFLFVDIGRIFMSASMAKSSADLALDSLMTNYDAELKEWYGLIASCQNVNEFYDESAKFFVRNLQSRGLSDDEILLLSDYYAQATNDDSIHDFLKSDVQLNGSGMIKKIPDMDLSNPAILRKEIVEFMKYRAPVEFTIDMIDRLKGDPSVKAAEEERKNEDMVNRKKEFYETEGEFLRKAFNTYIHIRNYQVKLENTDNIDRNGYYDFVTRINFCKEYYKKISHNSIKTLSVFKYMKPFDRNLDDLTIDYYLTKHPITNDHSSYDASRIDELIDKLNVSITNFLSEIDSFATNQTIKDALNVYGESYGTQWWSHFYNPIVTDKEGPRKKLETKAKLMLQDYARVSQISKHTKANGTADDYRSQDIKDILAKTQRICKLYINKNTKATLVNEDGFSNSSKQYKDYYNVVEKLENYSFSACYMKDPANVVIKFEYGGVKSERNLQDAIAFVGNELTTIRNQLQSYVNELNIAIDGNQDDNSVKKEDRAVRLMDLADLAEQYEQKLNSWESEVNNRYNDLGGQKKNPDNIVVQDKELLKNKGNETDQEFVHRINRDSVTKLNLRLMNIRTQFITMINYIDGITFCDEPVKNIKNVDKMVQVLDNKINYEDVPYKNQALNNYLDQKYNALFKPSKNLFVQHLKEDNWCPIINPETKSVSTPELYIYMHDKFKRGGEHMDEVEKGENLYDDAKKDSEGDPLKKLEQMALYHGNGVNIISSFSGPNNFNLIGSSLQSAMDLFNNLFNGNIDSIRDDLYVTSYIMNMFSCATFNNQGLYQLTEDKTSLNLNNYSNKYSKYNNEEEGMWLSPLLTDPYNKTLRNNLINRDNNSAFEAEIEYILFGGDKNSKNADYVRTAYLNIYGLRYPINLISGFANLWTSGEDSLSNMINLSAIGIQGLTHGIIPVPVSKTVLIALVTMFETFNDIERLNAGFPVELYKVGIDDWWLALSESTVKNKTSISDGISSLDKNNKGKGLFYSDYLTVFTYLGLTSDDPNSMYQRIAEVIEANMRKCSNNNNFSIKNSIVYHQLETKVRVKPLFLDLKIFSEGDYSTDLKDKDDLWTYEVKQTRGY